MAEQSNHIYTIYIAMEHKTVLDHFLHSLEQDYDSFPDKAELLKNLSEVTLL